MNDQMTVRSSASRSTTIPFFPVSRHFLTIPAVSAGRMWIGSSFPMERASTCAAVLLKRKVPSPENSRTGCGLARGTSATFCALASARLPSSSALARKGIVGLDALRQVSDERLEEVLALLRHDPRRQAAERLLGAPPLDHPSELDADLVHDHQDRLIQIDPLRVEDLQHPRDFLSHENREGEGRPQPQVMHQSVARKIGVIRDVRYPGRGRTRQDPSGQPDPPAEGEGLADLAEGLEALGPIEVPQTRGMELFLLIGLQEGMTDRPAREGADRVERRLQRLLDRRGLVRHGGTHPEKADEGAFLTELPSDRPQRRLGRLDPDLLIVSAHGTTPDLSVRG